MICRTPDDAFAAGLRDAAADPHPTPELVARVAVLLAPHQAPQAACT